MVINLMKVVHDQRLISGIIADCFLVEVVWERRLKQADLYRIEN